MTLTPPSALNILDRLFADDANIILWNEKLADLIDTCKEKYKHMIKWCYDNKFTINYDKTCSTLFIQNTNQCLGNYSTLISMEFLYSA